MEIRGERTFSSQLPSRIFLDVWGDHSHYCYGNICPGCLVAKVEQKRHEAKSMTGAPSFLKERDRKMLCTSRGKKSYLVPAFFGDSELSIAPYFDVEAIEATKNYDRVKITIISCMENG